MTLRIRTNDEHTSGVHLDWMATILQRTICPNLLGHQSCDSHTAIATLTGVDRITTSTAAASVASAASATVATTAVTASVSL
jgi:hypothetical protein